MPLQHLGISTRRSLHDTKCGNLVPPYENGPTETNAALEFAVNALEGATLVVEEARKRADEAEKRAKEVERRAEEAERYAQEAERHAQEAEKRSLELGEQVQAQNLVIDGMKAKFGGFEAMLATLASRLRPA